MAPDPKNRLPRELLKELIEEGSEAFRGVLEKLLNTAMQMEREEFLGARRCSLRSQRRDHANGYKDKTGSTPINRTFLKSPIMGERNVMAKRRKYSAEFKREAVQLANHPGVTKSQIARELGINSNMLGRWCRQLKTEGSKVFVGKGYARDDEMARLKRELARVKKERNFLKEAAAFFAKESS